MRQEEQNARPINSVHKTCKIQSRRHTGNIQGTFREHSGNIQGTFREFSWNIR
jgi:hypothetical protein